MSVAPATGTYLDRILAGTVEELSRRRSQRPLDVLERDAAAAPAPVPFTAALRGTGVAVVAEIKRASPSKGPIAPHAIATDVARDYIAGGAAAISVLTDERFFRGSIEDLEAVSALARSSGVPTLRKDFIIDPYQLAEARAAGASAAILIVAALDRRALQSLLAAANDYGLDALVEIHDAADLATAIDLGATLIGVNNRDLRSFTVDLATTERLAALVPESVTLIGESGIRTRDDVERLAAAGVHAVLVGETLMLAPDRPAALRELLG
jgi:indole-3-glycerol phosphate synthase